MSSCKQLPQNSNVNWKVVAMNYPDSILCAGSPIVDFLARVDDSFLNAINAEKGGMNLVDAVGLDALLAQLPSELEKSPGGSAGNTAFGLARLGMPVAFLGKLGKDPDGDFYRSTFEASGGRKNSFHSVQGVHTGRCLSMITPDSERTMRTDLGAAALMSAEEVTEAHFSNIRHVHLEGYLLFVGDLAEKIMATAKKCGCTLSLDLASFEVVRACQETLPQLLEKYVDLVFANEDEAEAFCGKDMTFAEQVTKLNDFCDIAVVKLGAAGCCVGKTKQTLEQVDALPVSALDTTAAGDLWASGFLYGWLNGAPLAECGRLGSLLGAEVVQVIGSQISDARWQWIKSSLTNNAH